MNPHLSWSKVYVVPRLVGVPRGGGGTQEWNQEESGSGHFREVAFVGSHLKSSDREMVGLLPAFVHGGRGRLSSASPGSYSIPAGQRK